MTFECTGNANAGSRLPLWYFAIQMSWQLNYYGLAYLKKYHKMIFSGDKSSLSLINHST